MEWLRGSAVDAGSLREEDLGLLKVVNEPSAVVDRVRDCHRTLCRRLGIST